MNLPKNKMVLASGVLGAIVAHQILKKPYESLMDSAVHVVTGGLAGAAIAVIALGFKKESRPLISSGPKSNPSGMSDAVEIAELSGLSDSFSADNGFEQNTFSSMAFGNNPYGINVNLNSYPGLGSCLPCMMIL